MSHGFVSWSIVLTLELRPQWTAAPSDPNPTSFWKISSIPIDSRESHTYRFQGIFYALHNARSICWFEVLQFGKSVTTLTSSELSGFGSKNATKTASVDPSSLSFAKLSLIASMKDPPPPPPSISISICGTNICAVTFFVIQEVCVFCQRKFFLRNKIRCFHFRSG